MRDFLRDFHEVTKLTEEREATINEMLSVLDFLLSQFASEALKYPVDSFMAAACNAGEKKLRKYWNLLVAKNPVYIVAVVLDPTQK